MKKEYNLIDNRTDVRHNDDCRFATYFMLNEEFYNLVMVGMTKIPFLPAWRQLRRVIHNCAFLSSGRFLLLNTPTVSLKCALSG